MKIEYFINRCLAQPIIHLKTAPLALASEQRGTLKIHRLRM